MIFSLYCVTAAYTRMPSFPFPLSRLHLPLPPPPSSPPAPPPSPLPTPTLISPSTGCPAATRLLSQRRHPLPPLARPAVKLNM